MLYKHLVSFARDTSGAVFFYLTLVLLVLLIAAGFAIDSSLVVYHKMRLQNAADASALAGAALIPENDGTLSAAEASVIATEAILFSRNNMQIATFGDVLATSDIGYGHWDTDGTHGAARTFYPQGSLPLNASLNAVTTTTREAQSNANPLTLMLIGLVSENSVNLATSAIAIAPPPEGPGCFKSGFFALGTTEGGSTNKFRDGFCMHGEQGVKLGSQNSVEGGDDAENPVTISLSDMGEDYGDGGPDTGSDNEVVPEEQFDDGVWSNNSLPAIIQERSITDYVNPGAANFPFDLSFPAGHSAHVQSATNRIDTLVADAASAFPPEMTFQHSNDDIDIDSNFSNAVVVSEKKIKIGSDVTMNNVILLAKENVEIGSDVTIGLSTFCDAPDLSVNFIMGAEMTKIGSDVKMTNLQIMAGEYVDWGSNDTSAAAVSVFSAGSLKFGSDWDIRGCGGANLFLDFSPNVASEPIRLVQ